MRMLGKKQIGYLYPIATLNSPSQSNLETILCFVFHLQLQAEIA